MVVQDLFNHVGLSNVGLSRQAISVEWISNTSGGPEALALSDFNPTEKDSGSF